MSYFISGDYVRPLSPNAGLPRDSVWAIVRYRNKDLGEVELRSINTTISGSYPASHVIGRTFYDYNFEKVVMVGGQWRSVDLGVPLSQLATSNTTAGRIDGKTVNCEDLVVADPVKDADKQVEQAAAALDAAKENARKAREEARAAAKAEAKRKAAIEAEKKALAEHKALSARLYADRCLGEATLALIAELSRLHNGGAEQVAPSSVAMHAEQLQPLAKSYGYKIAKPGALAIVVKA